MIINRKPESIQLFPWNSRGSGLEVVDVECSTDRRTWQLMLKRQLSNFTPFFSVGGTVPLNSRVDFKILLRELDQNYSFCLVDRLHGQQLWSAATNRQFTDVEFVVGGKSFHDHRAILAARSPYFATKCVIINCDPSAFEQLLFFVYTGGLQASADSRDLLQLGREYGIATLQSVCERALETNFYSITNDDVLRMSLVMKLPV